MPNTPGQITAQRRNTAIQSTFVVGRSDLISSSLNYEQVFQFALSLIRQKHFPTPSSLGILLVGIRMKELLLLKIMTVTKVEYSDSPQPSPKHKRHCEQPRNCGIGRWAREGLEMDPRRLWEEQVLPYDGSALSLRRKRSVWARQHAVCPQGSCPAEKTRYFRVWRTRRDERPEAPRLLVFPEEEREDRVAPASLSIAVLRRVTEDSELQLFPVRFWLLSNPFLETENATTEMRKKTTLPATSPLEWPLHCCTRPRRHP